MNVGIVICLILGAILLWIAVYLFGYQLGLRDGLDAWEFEEIGDMEVNETVGEAVRRIWGVTP